MELKQINDLFTEAKKKYAAHPFFSVLIPVIAKTRIARADNIKTACIGWKDGEPFLQFNPDFCSKYVRTPEDVLFILAHEVCHFILGHLNNPLIHYNAKYGKRCVNLAFDVIIDQLLYRHFGGEAGSLGIINYYKETKCPVRLLLPPVCLKEEEFEKESCKEVFRQISAGRQMTPYRLIQHLVSAHGFKIDHVSFIIERGWFGGNAPCHWGRVDARFKRLADRLLGQVYGCAGFHPQVEKRKQAFRTRFMNIIRDVANDGEARIEEQASGGGVLPHPGRRDFVNLSTGMPVVIYHANPVFEAQKGITVYLDVSGSMDNEMPKVFAALDSIKEFINFPIYAFSTRVHPVTRRNLESRDVLSTGGTDFDCVAEHAIRHRNEKLLLITDGFSDINPAYARTLKVNHQAVTLLSRHGTREEVKRFSREVVELE